MAVFTIKNAKDLGLAIRDRRRALRLNQATLAKQAGVSRQWIVDIEKGKPRAAVGLVLKTLHAVGISFTTNDPSDQKSGVLVPVADIDDVLSRTSGSRK